MNAYEQKQEARRARLEAASDRAAAKAAALFKRADLSEEVSGIPFGQPILVGHHSEGRHRAAIKRADQAMRGSIEADRRARDLAAKAAAVGSAGISSDDPDAVAKLAAKIEQAEASQVFMREANKVVRAFYKAGVRDAASGEAWSRYLEKLRALPHCPALSDAGAAALLQRDCVGRIGFADFQLSNNNANIGRMKQRLAVLQRASQATGKEADINGVRVVENVDANRLQLIFPGKPDADVRAKLKRFGFRWAPSEGAWQRQLNNAARIAAQLVLKDGS
jgi:hypothetical protein